MQFEKYDPEQHADKLMDWFTEKAVEPEDYERYKEAAEEAYHDFGDVFGLDREIRFVLAETDVSVLEDRYEEIPAQAYSQGFSADPNTESHDVEVPTVFMMTTSRYEYWEDSLKYVAVHELAHQKFYDNHDVGWRIFQRMLFEGHAMHSAEKVAEEKDYRWSQAGWKVEEVDPIEVRKELDRLNTWKGEQEGEVSTFFVPGGDRWPNAEGYPITYQLTENVRVRKGIGVSELLDLGFDEWRDEIEKSLEDEYGG
ncbi:MAG: hypothetical protein ABEK10_04080 [Candidatus Nanosalina sp.]